MSVTDNWLFAIKNHYNLLTETNVPREWLVPIMNLILMNEAIEHPAIEISKDLLKVLDGCITEFRAPSESPYAGYVFRHFRWYFVVRGDKDSRNIGADPIGASWWSREFWRHAVVDLVLDLVLADFGLYVWCEPWWGHKLHLMVRWVEQFF